MKTNRSNWTSAVLIGVSGLVLSGLVGCGPSTSTPKDSYSAQPPSVKSEKEWPKLEKEAREFLQKNQGDPREGQALLDLGIALQAQGKYEEARDTLQDLVNRFPAFKRITEARYRLADSYYNLKSYEQTIAVADDIRRNKMVMQGEEQFLSQANWLRALALADSEIYIESAKAFEELLPTVNVKKDTFDTQVKIATLLRKAGDNPRALEYLAKAATSTEFEQDLGPVYLAKAEIEVQLNKYAEAVLSFSKVIDNARFQYLHEEAIGKLNAWLQTIDNKPQFSEMTKVSISGRTGYLVHIGYVQLLEEFEEYQSALQELDRVTATYRIQSSVYDENAVRTHEERLKAKLNTKLNTIGLLLPLSGPLEAYSNRMLRGAKLAVDQYNEAFPKNAVTLVTANSLGTAEGAAVGAKKLMTQDFVVGLIGPVLPAEAKAVAPLADQYNVPVILPATGATGIAELSPYLFRNCLTTKAQADALAAYAVEQRHLRSFGVLAPKNEFGDEISNLFLQALKAKGVTDVYAVQYDPNKADFTTEIKTLAKMNLDAVFLPDHADIANKIIGQMLYLSFPKVTYLGSNLWNTPDLLKNEGYLEGAIFVDGFFEGARRAETTQFVTRYRSVYGESPDLFAAQAYDSVQMFLTCRMGQAKSRVQMAECLYKFRDFPAATGSLSVDRNGEVLRPLAILSIQKGKIVQLN